MPGLDAHEPHAEAIAVRGLTAPKEAEAEWAAAQPGRAH